MFSFYIIYEQHQLAEVVEPRPSEPALETEFQTHVKLLIECKHVSYLKRLFVDLRYTPLSKHHNEDCSNVTRISRYMIAIKMQRLMTYFLNVVIVINPSVEYIGCS